MTIHNNSHNQPTESHNITPPDSTTAAKAARGSKDSGLDQESWTYRFRFEGKRYTLRKRNKSRDGNWMIDVIIAGKRIPRGLGTNVASAAEKRAIESYIKPAKQERWDEVKAPRLRQDYAKLARVMACYEQLCIGKLPALTVRANLNSFRLVVRRGLGNDGMSNEAVGELSASVLTGKLVAEFEDWMARKAAVEKRDIEANKRSVEGYLRQARSLFKATALPRYGEKGVKLPEVTEFMKRRVELAARVVKVPPSDELLTKTFEGAMKLRESDRPAFIAWLLGLCSLRRGEIARARWDWVMTSGGRACLLVPPEAAKSDAARMVPIDARVARELEEFKQQRCVGLDAEEEAFVLPSPRLGQGGPDVRLRAQNVFKRVNQFMRGCGWTTNKTLHELRALYLMWVRDDYGLDTAQAVAGHSDQRTTQNNYVGRKAVHGVTITLPLPLPLGS